MSEITCELCQQKAGILLPVFIGEEQEKEYWCLLCLIKAGVQNLWARHWISRKEYQWFVTFREKYGFIPLEKEIWNDKTDVS